jgi:hypothetical protein
MGGYGSGRWRWPTKEYIVEDCRVLNVNRRTREGILLEGPSFWLVEMVQCPNCGSNLFDWVRGEHEREVA